MDSYEVKINDDKVSEQKIDVSIIIPIYNESENIDRFEKELIKPLQNTNLNYEILAVDDGSTDGSWSKLENLSNKFNTFIALKHSRNFGLGAAYQSAISESRGEKIITYSSDLEVSALYIQKVADLLDKYDIVNTHRIGRWRESAKTSIVRRIPSIIANKIIERISGVSIKDTGSGLKGFKSYIIKNIKIYGDMHRFLIAYSTQYTNNITEIEVEYQERKFGEAHYGSITRTFSVFLDLFALYFLLRFATKPFTMMPGRSFGSLGLVSFFLGLGVNIYLLVWKFVYGHNIGDRPLFIIGILLIILGVQLLMTGFLGEIMLRTYFESKSKTPYLVVKNTRDS